MGYKVSLTGKDSHIKLNNTQALDALKIQYKNEMEVRQNDYVSKCFIILYPFIQDEDAEKLTNARDNFTLDDPEPTYSVFDDLARKYHQKLPSLPTVIDITKEIEDNMDILADPNVDLLKQQRDIIAWMESEPLEYEVLKSYINEYPIIKNAFIRITTAKDPSAARPLKPNDDYDRVDPETGAIICEIQGLRATQEDRVTTGNISTSGHDSLTDSEVQDSLRETTVKLQEKIASKQFRDGSTMISCVVQGNKIHTASLADSNAYLITKKKVGESVCTRLNKKLHLASLQEEQDRVEKFLKQTGHPASFMDHILSGMKFQGNPRLGSLQPTRGFGDLDHEEIGYSHDPDTVTDVAPVGENIEKNYLVMCCDGLYECAKKQGISDEKYVMKLFEAQKDKPQAQIAKGMVDQAFKDGSIDNISAIVIELDPTSNKINVYCIFDGHGGSRTAQFLADEFISTLQEIMANKMMLRKAPVDVAKPAAVITPDSAQHFAVSTQTDKTLSGLTPEQRFIQLKELANRGNKDAIVSIIASYINPTKEKIVWIQKGAEAKIPFCLAYMIRYKSTPDGRLEYGIKEDMDGAKKMYQTLFNLAKSDANAQSQLKVVNEHLHNIYPEKKEYNQFIISSIDPSSQSQKSHSIAQDKNAKLSKTSANSQPWQRTDPTINKTQKPMPLTARTKETTAKTQPTDKNKPIPGKL